MRFCIGCKRLRSHNVIINQILGKIEGTSLGKAMTATHLYDSNLSAGETVLGFHSTDSKLTPLPESRTLVDVHGDENAGAKSKSKSDSGDVGELISAERNFPLASHISA